jgi:CheY-like chemotaxis protein
VYNPPDDSYTQKDRLLPTETLETNTSSLKGLKVLVVDDSKDCRILIGVVFKEYQAEVKLAGSVDEAIEIMEKWEPNVLISDICMLNKDGYFLIHSIRKKNKLERTFLPAIVITAYPEKSFEALEAGFQEIIIKPFEHSELVAQVVKLSSTGINKSDKNR